MSPRAVTKRPKIAPRQPQDDLEDSCFSYLFLTSILVRFGCDFGSLWAPFLEPKSVIFGIDFWMIFACRSKIAPRAAKSGPRAAKSAPRSAKSSPRAARSSQKRTKSGQKRPKRGQERPKRCQKRPMSGNE